MVAWLDMPNWMAGCLDWMVGCLAGWQPCPRMPKVSNRTELTNKMPGLIKRVAEMRVHRIAQNLDSFNYDVFLVLAKLTKSILLYNPIN